MIESGYIAASITQAGQPVKGGHILGAYKNTGNSKVGRCPD
jgi:hypothetical protein